MTERAGYIWKSGITLLQWENNDFPLLCNDCMGQDEFVKFIKILQAK